MDEARRRLKAFRERFAKTAPKALTCLEEGFEDAMAVMALPEKYRTRFRSTNRLERLHEEIRRRERVIGHPSRLCRDGTRSYGSSPIKSPL